MILLTIVILIWINMKIFSMRYWIVFFLSFLLISCGDNEDGDFFASDGGSPQPIPDNSSSDAKIECPAPLQDKPELVITHDAYTVSYNTTTMCPNYVAWHLTAERINGTAERLSTFKVDPDIPVVYQIKHADYTNSGYDRGHMCPAADNKCSVEYMTQSFYTSNICPQTATLNRGDWETLEDKCRDWVQTCSDLYIVCGPIFDNQVPPYIAPVNRPKITVPDRFFKVILCLGASPKAIGFIYYNDETKKSMRDYTVTIDEIEYISGIDFFPSLSVEQQHELESVNSPEKWGM